MKVNDIKEGAMRVNQIRKVRFHLNHGSNRWSSLRSDRVSIKHTKLNSLVTVILSKKYVVVHAMVNSGQRVIDFDMIYS